MTSQRAKLELQRSDKYNREVVFVLLCVHANVIFTECHEILCCPPSHPLVPQSETDCTLLTHQKEWGV